MDRKHRIKHRKGVPERHGLDPPMMNCPETDERITIDFVTKATLARGYTMLN